METAAPRGTAADAASNDLDSRDLADSAPSETTHKPTRSVFVVSLRAPSDRDAIHTLRAALKLLWRRFGLRCLRIEELVDGEGKP